MINNLYKKFRRFGLALLACGLLNPDEDALAQSKKEEISPAKFSLDVNSKYLLRGVPLSDMFVLQPSLTLSKGGITSSVFGVIDPNGKDANEADILVDYTKALNNRLNLSVGYSYINFPDIGEKTQEVYSGLSFQNVRLKPSIFLYRDLDYLTGTYIEASVANNFKLGKINLEEKLILAYNHNYFIDNSGFSHINASLSLPLKICNGAVLSGKVSYLKALNHYHIKDLGKDLNDKLVYGLGINLEL